MASQRRSGGGKRDVLVVTSGELMALYAANNLARAVRVMTEAGADIKLLGYVVNMRGVPQEREIVQAFSEATQVPILAYIPRDPLPFRQAELAGGTVVRKLPNSDVTQIFRQLASDVDQGAERIEPRPFEKYDDLWEMFINFQKKEVADARLEDITARYVRMLPSEVVKRERPKRICIYGTGGIGKSTTSCNLTAALVTLGEKVLQIGCDPKRDSIANICGELKPTVMGEIARLGERSLNKDFFKQLVFEGVCFDNRVHGLECGGPIPGRGCAGKGVDVALRYLEQFKVLNEYDFTFIIYDVLGDTVCGGFASPMKAAPLTYIITSGEISMMTQALRIAQGVETSAKSGIDTGIGGIINNMRGIPHEEEIVEKVFGTVGLPVIAHIPRSPLVQEAENLRSTVVQTFPDSDQAEHYLALAKVVQQNEEQHHLTREPLSHSEIMAIADKYTAIPT